MINSKSITLLLLFYFCINSLLSLKSLLAQEDHPVSRIKLNPPFVHLAEGTAIRSNCLLSNNIGAVDLSKPDVLASLSDDSLQILLNLLAQNEIKIRWYDEDNKIQSAKERRHKIFFWKKSDHTNAAAALAFTTGVRPELKQLLSRIIALEPNAVIPYLLSHAGFILSQQVVSDTLFKMLMQIKEETDERTLLLGSDLVHAFLKYKGNEKKEVLQLHLSNLLKDTIVPLIQNEAPVDHEKKLGIFFGMIISGALKYAKEIKSSDEHHLWLMNSITNTVWAATTFLATIPIAGNIASAVGGAVSLSLVIANAIYSEQGPRDFSNAIREIQGKIELKSLDSSFNDRKESIFNALKILAYMNSVIHINGFSS
ncbi:MAG: hypothetical protein HQK52_10710 [Oligoflexia bacterium]|nr:hypothetical protein [Oligoflexia bacterium]